MRWLPAVIFCGLVLAGCGSTSKPSAEEPLVRTPAAGALEHIHGLGRDGNRLLIATHAGLFAQADGDPEPALIGSSRQDLMGFTVAGDRLIASGHPELTDDAPPMLGLIESRDRGTTWRTVALRGKADFHVLEAAGKRLYGFDGHDGRLQVSRDGGRTWRKRAVPAPVYDLAVDAALPGRVVAATEQGIYTSRDDGRTWTQRSPSLTGLIAWDGTDLVLVDAGGALLRSADLGASFVAVGTTGAPPAALLVDDNELFVAAADGVVRQSTDGGATWTVRLKTGGA